MIVMMVAVILVIIIQVLPVFQQVFEQLGGEMSQFAQGLMSFGRGVSQYAVWIAAGLAVVAAGVVFLPDDEKGKAFFAALGAKLFQPQPCCGFRTVRLGNGADAQLRSGFG